MRNRRAASMRSRRCERCPPAGHDTFLQASPSDALGLATAAVLVVLARHGGEHVEHHSVDGAEHARRELIAGAASCQEVGRSSVTTRNWAGRARRAACANQRPSGVRGGRPARSKARRRASSRRSGETVQGGRASRRTCSRRRFRRSEARDWLRKSRLARARGSRPARPYHAPVRAAGAGRPESW